MKTSHVLLATLALPALIAAAPATVLHGDPACDDAVAEIIHDLEEGTGLHPLHEVEEAYCDHVVPLLP